MKKSEKLLISAINNINKNFKVTCNEIWISINTLKEFIKWEWTNKTEKLIYAWLLLKQENIWDYIWMYKEAKEEEANQK